MTTPPKLHKVIPEHLFAIAQMIDALRVLYGPAHAAHILETCAKALRTGRFPNAGKEREIFLMKDKAP